MPASTKASKVGRFAPPGSPNTTSTPSALRHSIRASTARMRNPAPFGTTREGTSEISGGSLVAGARWCAAALPLAEHDLGLLGLGRVAPARLAPVARPAPPPAPADPALRAGEPRPDLERGLVGVA